MFKKGISGNKGGRPKTAHLDTAKRLKVSQMMIEQGCDIVSGEWESVVRSMVKQAQKGNVPAASWLRDTFIGKPKEVVSHEIDQESKGMLTLAYSIKKDD